MRVFNLFLATSINAFLASLSTCNIFVRINSSLLKILDKYFLNSCYLARYVILYMYVYKSTTLLALAIVRLHIVNV